MSTETLEWEQRPARQLVKLSWPILISMISYSTMTLVDTLLVSGLGAAQLAGVGLGGTAAFTLLCFSFGLLRGAKTLVAQAIGAGRKDEVGATLGAALVAAAGLSVVTVAAGQLVAELVARLAATDPAGQAARTYLHLRNLGAPAALFYVALREVRYGQGDARSPMRATVLANVVNATLAYVFVFHFGWGVAGAGAATAIAHFVEAGTLALQMGRGGFRVSGTRARHLEALWRIGWPSGLQFTLEVGAFALLAALISAMSETQMAAHQIALQVIHFAFLPAFAVGEAASVLAGQAVGADRDGLVLAAARVALRLTGAYTALWTLGLGLGAPLVVAGFRVDAEVGTQAVRLLHIAAVFQMLDAANIVARAVLRGAGDVRVPAWVGVLSSWAFLPPLTWLLGYRLGLGAAGGWLGFVAETAAGAAVLWWRLQRGQWRSSARAARERLRAARADGPALSGLEAA
jgi:MATE family multidrug resistance protein